MSLTEDPSFIVRYRLLLQCAHPLNEFLGVVDIQLVNDLVHFVDRQKQDKNKDLKDLALTMDKKIKFYKIQEKHKV